MNKPLDLTELVDMDGIIARQEGEPVHLLQTAGPGAERSFRVLPLQRAIIGRSDSAAISVDEGDVSRQHALVEHQDGEPRIIDLGSTNGTFVNGQRIDNVGLATGDRVQIGSAVFDVVVGKRIDAEPSPSAGLDPEARSQMARIHEELRGAPSGSGPLVVQQTILSGSLESIGLASLLQILEANRNSGSLLLHLAPGVGQVHLRNGRVDDAIFVATRGMKALTRLMACSGGRFELVTPGFEPDRPTIEGQLDALLLTAMTEIDEFTQYRAELPPDGALLVFNPSRYFVLSRMPPDLFDVLACIARHRTVGRVIDECHLSDLAICRHLLMLLNEDIVTAEVAEEDLPEPGYEP